MNMDIDSPLDSSPPLKPLDRVLHRLKEVGVPEVLLSRLYPGIVDFVAEDSGRIPKLVSVILPTDEEVAEVIRDSKGSSVKKVMKNRFRECLAWLKWMMFMDDPSVVLGKLSSENAARGVCGVVWGNNDIAYRCRTCEHDPTCAICVPCFRDGDHKDHDYSVLYTGGGCCDCGDVTAWKREGFCSRHKGAEQVQPLQEEYARSVGPVLDALLDFWRRKLVIAESVAREVYTDSLSSALPKKYANELTFVVVEMLLEFCSNCESLLSFISQRLILVDGLLENLVRGEKFLSQSVSKKLHELLLKFLAEPIFKYAFAAAFLGYYPSVVHKAITEDGDNGIKKYPLLSSFSVQIFTVPTLTPQLVFEMNLLAMLLQCLGDIFTHCAGEDGRLLTTKWARLYETTIRVVEDIRFVMSHKVVARYVMHEQREILRSWMKLLSFLQGMSPLKRETGIHVEEETENVNYPFVLAHSMANIHSLMLDGAFSTGDEKDHDPFVIRHKLDTDAGETKLGFLWQETSVCSLTRRTTASIDAVNLADVESSSAWHPSIPPSVMCFTLECLRAIENSLEVYCKPGLQLSKGTTNSSGSFLSLKKTLSKLRKGRYVFVLPNSRDDTGSQSSSHAYGTLGMEIDKENATVFGKENKTSVYGAVNSSTVDDKLHRGDNSTEVELLCLLGLSHWPSVSYDVSSQSVSVHIPLHRLLSILLHTSLRRYCSESVASTMTGRNNSPPLSATHDDFFSNFLIGCHPYGFSAFIMENPLRNRVFIAQVHAGMWKKNGDAAILSREWYRSVQWSEQGLELDLFLLQCCASIAPADLYVNRILECFGLSDYLSFNPKQSNKYESVLVQEMLKLIIQIVQERHFAGLTPAENLRRELVHKLAIRDLTHSQLVKSLPRDLSKFDKLQEILDTVALYSNPSGFNQGKYSLRGPYWQELDLYHPRWDSTDFQLAEERYLRHCNSSALTSQLPRWTGTYLPLKGIAGIATCKMTFQVVRAALFYALFCDKTSESRAPDNVLLTALHLLSLALDICFQMRESMDTFVYVGGSPSVLASAGEKIVEAIEYGVSDQSLLSILVALMRVHKKQSSDIIEAGSCNFSSLIEGILIQFAELDSGCMHELQQLAPELVMHLPQAISCGDAFISDKTSEGEDRKAKARERQAAILAKMKAEQSRFLSSIGSMSDDDDSKFGLEGNCPTDTQELEESDQVVCSLCHDPNLKSPVSFLVLLQKSRLLSHVNKPVPSWDQVQPSDNLGFSLSESRVGDQSGSASPSSGSGMDSSTQLVQFAQKIVNKFADYAQPAEVNDVIEFFKAHFLSSCDSQVSCTAKDQNDRTESSFEMFELEMYTSVQKDLHDHLEIEKFPAPEGGLKGKQDAAYAMFGKYVAALSREMLEHPLDSKIAHAEDLVVSTSQSCLPHEFGPTDGDGVYLSSCGHAVHQGCLDRYLISVRHRFARRIIVEGGEIVDPDQGEFLCPVCRRLANSALPSLHGVSQKLWKQPMISMTSSSHVGGTLSASAEQINCLLVQKAFHLLQSCTRLIENGEILKMYPLPGNDEMGPNFDLFSRVLSRLYFPDRHDNFYGSKRMNPSMIMWDTLKFSLVSMEIAARPRTKHWTTTYSFSALQKELKSSSGFTLSLLLKLVQILKSKNLLHVLQRMRAVQLFTQSICFGGSLHNGNSTDEQGGDISCILRYTDKKLSYPDTQFWYRAAEPILAHDAFSSLMWMLFCLPHPFLSCEKSFLSLVHMFYVVSVAQAIITYGGKYHWEKRDSDLHDCLITDICKILRESGWIQQCFVSNYINRTSDIRYEIRRLSSTYLRRCALLWRLLTTPAPSPFCNEDYESNSSSDTMQWVVENVDGDLVALSEVEELEKMFKIPQLHCVLEDQMIRSLVTKWLKHFSKVYKMQNFHSVLHLAPAVPFKLMSLPHVYQDLLQRYIKQRCVDCKKVIDEPALCLLCGKLCSSNWRLCCRNNGCQNHAVSCAAGMGVFLLVKRTTILLVRGTRQASWHSLYLDEFGEEDLEMHRGKPLYLNEERYAALNHLFASHGLERSSTVAGQNTMGTFFFLV